MNICPSQLTFKYDRKIRVSHDKSNKGFTTSNLHYKICKKELDPLKLKKVYKNFSNIIL